MLGYQVGAFCYPRDDQRRLRNGTCKFDLAPTCEMWRSEWESSLGTTFQTTLIFWLVMRCGVFPTCSDHPLEHGAVAETPFAELQATAAAFVDDGEVVWVGKRPARHKVSKALSEQKAEHLQALHGTGSRQANSTSARRQGRHSTSDNRYILQMQCALEELVTTGLHVQAIPVCSPASETATSCVRRERTGVRRGLHFDPFFCPSVGSGHCDKLESYVPRYESRRKATKLNFSAPRLRHGVWQVLDSMGMLHMFPRVRC